MEREFIRVTARSSEVPLWICVQQIGAVMEDVSYDSSRAEYTRLGKAAVLVQGQWLHLEQSHAAVVALIEEALR